MASHRWGKTDLHPAQHAGQLFTLVGAPEGRSLGTHLLHSHRVRLTADARPPALEFDPDCFLDDRVEEYLVPNPLTGLAWRGEVLAKVETLLAVSWGLFEVVRKVFKLESRRLCSNSMISGTRAG